MSNDIAVRHATLPIPGYEGRYAVTSDGQVISLARTITDALGRTIRRPQRTLRPATEGGYRRVSLDNGETKHSHRVHRLMLLAFVGPPPEGKPEACHVNGNSLDNRIENLRWGSHSDNMLDKVTHGTCHWTNRTQCPHGHPYDERNTWINPRGARVCRACLARNARERRARMRGAA